MSVLTILGWIIAIGLAVFFCYFWLIPFIRIKLSLWIVHWKLKKLARQYKDDKSIQDLADLSKDVAKSYSIDDVHKSEDDE